MDDYLKLGVLAALEAVVAILPGAAVHARRLLPGRHAAGDRGRARWRAMTTTG